MRVKTPETRRTREFGKVDLEATPPHSRHRDLPVCNLYVLCTTWICMHPCPLGGALRNWPHTTRLGEKGGHAHRDVGKNDLEPGNAVPKRGQLSKTASKGSRQVQDHCEGTGVFHVLTIASSRGTIHTEAVVRGNAVNPFCQVYSIQKTNQLSSTPRAPHARPWSGDAGIPCAIIILSRGIVIMHC